LKRRAGVNQVSGLPQPGGSYGSRAAFPLTIGPRARFSPHSPSAASGSSDPAALITIGAPRPHLLIPDHLARNDQQQGQH